MYEVVVCTCGKSLRAYEGMTEIRCPVCKQSIHAAKPAGTDISAPAKPTPTADPQSPAIILFGLDPPPPPSIQKTPLKYQVVEVSSEITPVRPRKKEPAEEDDDRPYAVERSKDDKSNLKSQEEMWGHDVDLSADPNAPWAALKKEKQKEKGRRRDRAPSEWTLETSWYECLAYPLRGWPLIAGLGFALTFATFGLLQSLRDEGPLAWVFWLIGGVALAYGCGFLTCVLNAGASGTLDIHWPGANPKILLESLLAAFMSFLAGPIIPASLAVYFWINSGDMVLIDKLILAELMILTIGYWLLVFLSAARSDSWGSLLPAAVFQHARKLGVGKTCFALGFAIGIFVFHSLLALAGLEALSAGGFILLLLCWMSLLFWMVFLMRWLGVCIYRLRSAARRKAKSAV